MEDEFIVYAKHDVVTKAAYIAGVNENAFKYGPDPQRWLHKELFDELEKNKEAKIIRSLCKLRNNILLDFGYADTKIKKLKCSLYTLSDVVDTKDIMYLESQGVKFVRAKSGAGWIVNINKAIQERIMGVQKLFPAYMPFDYIKQLIIMPGGTSENQANRQISIFRNNARVYPNKTYLNYSLTNTERALFINDTRFAKAIFKEHNKEFNDYNKTRDLGESARNGVEDFIEEGTVFLVDCENADPYYFYSMISELENKENIKKIILFLDENTTSAWQILKGLTDVPTINYEVERLLENKSQVDFALITEAMKMKYEEHVNRMVIVSSDSDYWNLIKSLPDVNFMVLLERQKTSKETTKNLEEHKIKYVFTEDYSYDTTYSLKKRVVMEDFKGIEFNIKEMFNKTILEKRIRLSDSEYKTLFEEIKRNIKFCLIEDSFVIKS